MHMTIFFACFLRPSPRGLEQFVIHVNNKCINFATYLCTKDSQTYSLDYRGLEHNIPASFVVDSFNPVPKHYQLCHPLLPIRN